SSRPRIFTDETDQPLYATAPPMPSDLATFDSRIAAKITTYQTDDLEGFVRFMDLEPARRFRHPRGLR
ncbi:MAG: hypothetical protein H6Q78_239, partial [Candidatus Krumholzibacteriota bacterium]|nr:hypothetical protein [Candidatus Krumholzibacteriota bacterium]